MFSITLIDTSLPIGRGEIVFGDVREALDVALEYWSPSAYERQWSEALRTLSEDRRASALITSLTDPDHANFLFWWPAYPDGADIVFQNGILLLDELDEPFKLSRYDDYVPPRQRTTEDGEPISEWRVPIADIRAFLARSTR